jgi:Ca-activated chloride channel family protein
MRAIAGAALLSVLLGSLLFAQDPPPQAVFKSESELVVLHVQVTDRGQYVQGLNREAFRLYDEDRAQTPKFFLNEDAPVTVGLVIDSSGSMVRARERVIASSTEFVKSSNPEDEIFAVLFNDEVRNAIGDGSFTKDPVVLGGALARAFQPEGRTALYDAVIDGLEYAARGSHDRRVLVVLSDGGDNASKATLKDVVTAVQSSNTVIYTVAIADPYDADANPAKLRQLAEMSGGQSMKADDLGQVRDVFQKIARDIRHMYTIGFEPTNTAYHAGFHKLRVEARMADGRKLSVRSRPGYQKAHVGP